MKHLRSTQEVYVTHMQARLPPKNVSLPTQWGQRMRLKRRAEWLKTDEGELTGGHKHPVCGH